MGSSERRLARWMWTITLSLIALLAAGSLFLWWRTLPISVSLMPDQRSVTARRGPVRIWTVDVVAACEAQGGAIRDPVVEPRVRELKVEGDVGWFVYGKHSFGSIDVLTGAVSYWGSD